MAYSPDDEYDDDAGPNSNCQMHHQTKRSVHEGRSRYMLIIQIFAMEFCQQKDLLQDL